MRPARIEALSDGIFAIVMTLLILELKVPILHNEPVTSLGLLDALSHLWPKFLSYLTSFVILAIYWLSHHIQFGYIARTNFNHVWMNLIFLLFVTFIPFSTAFLGEYPTSVLAHFIYGLNLIACGCALYVSWHYAITENRLTDPNSISKTLEINARHKILLPPAIYFVAMVTSLVSPILSLIIFALGPILYFVPIDSHTWNFLIIKSPINRAKIIEVD